MDCKILVPEDFVLNIVSNSGTRKRYEQYAFNDYVDVSIDFVSTSPAFKRSIHYIPYTNTQHTSTLQG